MVSLFVSFIQIAWIKGPLTRQIKLCQEPCVVAGKKKIQKASGFVFPGCCLLPGQKKDFRNTGKTGRWVTKLWLSLYRAQAARQHSPVPAWAAGPCPSRASAASSTASSPSPFPASCSLGLKDQRSCYNTKPEISCRCMFFVWPIMLLRKTLTAEFRKPECFAFSLFGKQVSCSYHLYNLKQNTGNSLSNYWRWQ